MFPLRGAVNKASFTFLLGLKYNSFSKLGNSQLSHWVQDSGVNGVWKDEGETVFQEGDCAYMPSQVQDIFHCLRAFLVRER